MAVLSRGNYSHEGLRNMKTQVIKVTVSEDEKAEIRAASKSEGMDMSTFLRVAALRLARGK